jgi:hypothetical protein
MKLKKIVNPLIIALACLLVLFPHIVLAQQFMNSVPNEARKIIQQTLAADGHLNEEMHSQFWQSMRSLRGTEEELQKGMELLKASMSIHNQIQKASWESIRLSWTNENVVRTDELTQLTEDLAISVEENSPYEVGTDNHTALMNGFETSFAQSMESINVILSAAAERKRYVETPTGNMSLNMNLIEYVIANIDSSFDRAERLFSPTWEE